MRTACLVLVVAFFQASAHAQSPEIEVVDGKISMSVTAMPLGRLLTLLDRAMGTTSDVKPELANRNISAQFTGLEFNDAVRKIFQGQPLNYMIISGKGIRVTDLAQAGAASTASTAPAPASSFPEPQIFPNNNPIPPTLSIQPQGIFNPGGQQGANPNPGFTMTPFGPQPIPGGNQNANPNGGPLSGPGTLPPALGMGNNPLNPGANGGGNQGGVNGVNNGVAFPILPGPTAPPAPGSLGGATPGTLGK